MRRKPGAEEFSAPMLILARNLVALEAKNQTAPESHRNEAVRTCEKLRIVLTRFAGVDGCRALLRRALALACVDDPSLRSVNVEADGRLEGLAELLSDETKGKTPASTAIIKRLLELLVTFVGESITLQLIREAWPDLSTEEWHSRSKTL